MLGNLKEKAMAKAVSALEEKFGPVIHEKIEMFKELKPSDVNDDEKYQNFIVNPLWTLVKMQSGGAVSTAQKFIDVEGKFNTGLFNVRDELITVEDEKILLDPEFSDKIVPVLMASIKS
jgi:hypothetical protein